MHLFLIALFITCASYLSSEGRSYYFISNAFVFSGYPHHFSQNSLYVISVSFAEIIILTV